MLIPKKNRIAVYSHLFKEGIMVASDEPNLAKHMELENIPNLQVIKLMESLTSRGFVRKTYTWNHFYWFLTNEGITYLREFLNLPEMIVPNTHKKAQTRPPSRPEGGGDRGGFGRGPPRDGDRPGGGFGRGRGGDRDSYRKEPSSYGDRPSFGGGRGREGGPPGGGDRPRFGGRGGAPPTAP
uniref:Plectin/eS10 N-terminal domain-containing protein n=1 Tax=Hemiselmis tepida TaxID=464990 RepID=A0A6T6RK56_9CRYP|mmetsp:Transcript_10858/g.28208  ORF Transcript_10858/g.28208 Transcript_10858/m.28208 type:complete len:182 (+) Transcript_10858:71-616(+)|eukprot:CAMPEP_0174929608 /NCGR_PEP_ID=MMETSP1355-20121228/27927_1 /TAXON_ID=464990 /ORGANISM="Hemiselmis tepida, Strain CCMP443" /LENGTH=181 /DNA_ID=CAMNT_0016175827 /DNA_START=47 /DNA_END=592 /DNA_ORIENTATION=+